METSAHSFLDAKDNFYGNPHVLDQRFADGESSLLQFASNANGAAVQGFRKMLVGPLEYVDQRLFRACSDMPTTRMRPPGRSMRWHSFNTFGISGVSNNSKVMLRVHDYQLGSLTLRDRVVKLDAFPMGIDFEKFARAA